MSGGDGSAEPGLPGSNPRGDVRETGFDKAEQVVEDLAAQVETLQERVDELEAKVDQADHRVADRVEDRLLDELDDRIKDEQIERTGSIADAKLKLEEDIDEVREQLRAEQSTRTQQNALTNKRITHLADQVGETIDDDEIMLEDKLVRVIKHGVRDILADPNRRHERARAILIHLADWGQVHSDGNGKRATVTASDVKPPLSERGDVRMSTSMVKRAFEAIVDWSEDSPRRCRNMNRNGERRLVVWQPDQLLAAAEEVSG